MLPAILYYSGRVTEVHFGSGFPVMSDGDLATQKLHDVTNSRPTRTKALSLHVINCFSDDYTTSMEFIIENAEFLMIIIIYYYKS